MAQLQLVYSFFVLDQSLVVVIQLLVLLFKFLLLTLQLLNCHLLFLYGGMSVANSLVDLLGKCLNIFGYFVNSAQHFHVVVLCDDVLLKLLDCEADEIESAD